MNDQLRSFDEFNLFPLQAERLDFEYVIGDVDEVLSTDLSKV